MSTLTLLPSYLAKSRKDVLLCPRPLVLEGSPATSTREDVSSGDAPDARQNVTPPSPRHHTGFRNYQYSDKSEYHFAFRPESPGARQVREDQDNSWQICDSVDTSSGPVRLHAVTHDAASSSEEPEPPKPTKRKPKKKDALQRNHLRLNARAVSSKGTYVPKRPPTAQRSRPWAERVVFKRSGKMHVYRPVLKRPHTATGHRPTSARRLHDTQEQEGRPRPRQRPASARP